MTNNTTINASELPAFDMVDYLKTDEDIAQYLSEPPRLSCRPVGVSHVDSVF